MAKANIKATSLIMLLLFVVGFYVDVTNGQLCAVNCGNGYCCPASHPLCVQGLPMCCPPGSAFYYNGYCYSKLATKLGGGEQKQSAGIDAARTIL